MAKTFISIALIAILSLLIALRVGQNDSFTFKITDIICQNGIKRVNYDFSIVFDDKNVKTISQVPASNFVFEVEKIEYKIRGTIIYKLYFIKKLDLVIEVPDDEKIRSSCAFWTKKGKLILILIFENDENYTTTEGDHIASGDADYQNIYRDSFFHKGLERNARLHLLIEEPRRRFVSQNI